MLKDIELRFSNRLGKFLQAMVIGTFVPITFTNQAVAAEGGYSNYIPGTYGDFGMALAPTETWTLRNDIYYYSADGDKSLRSGILEVDADLDFPMNFTTVLYKPDLKIFGGQYATGIFVPVMDLEINATVALGPVNRKLNDSASGLGDIALREIRVIFRYDDSLAGEGLYAVIFGDFPPFGNH